MEKKKPAKLNIGLMGFEFCSPNKGCEALSYSFINFLQEYSRIHNTRLTVYSWGTELGMIPGHFPDLEFVYTRRKIKDPKCRWIRTVRKCDLVFDVTMGDSFSDIYSEEYCLRLIKEKKIVELLNKEYYLLPQTYGPYHSDTVRPRAISVINKAKAVFSRDKASVDYLREIGISREIKEHIDLAFMLPYDRSRYALEKGTKKDLGINVSGLLWKGGFTGQNQFGLKMDYKEYITEIIRHFSQGGEWNVHLIPHVVDMRTNPHDDDWKTVSDLHEMFPNTVLAPAFDNPIDAKSYIANMDFFIGARMHSTIAAISAGVPVLPVSYSRKFEGLYDRLDYHHLVHGKEMSTEEAIRYTVYNVGQYQTIKTEVSKTQKMIEERVNLLKDELLEIAKEKI